MPIIIESGGERQPQFPTLAPFLYPHIRATIRVIIIWVRKSPKKIMKIKKKLFHIITEICYEYTSLT